MNYNYKTLSLVGNRDHLICSLCKNKKVLHIGATDAPYTQEKIDQGLLLHTQIMESTQDVEGIDIDQPAIDLLKTKGITNIQQFDMNRLGDVSFTPDVIVFGEIIEHLENFQIALENLKHAMTPETELIISTPNRFYILSFIMAVLQQKESIHDDHKVIFSYGALDQLLSANGLKIDSAAFTFLPRASESIFKKLIRLLCKLRPCASETLLVVAKLEK